MLFIQYASIIFFSLFLLLPESPHFLTHSTSCAFPTPLSIKRKTSIFLSLENSIYEYFSYHVLLLLPVISMSFSILKFVTSFLVYSSHTPSQEQFPLPLLLPVSPLPNMSSSPDPPLFHFPSDKGKASMDINQHAYQVAIRLGIYPLILGWTRHPNRRTGSQIHAKASKTSSSPTVRTSTRTPNFTTITHMQRA